jgi:error-prone DNA polymerase
VRADEVTALERARIEGGPFRSVAELAARVPAARSSLEQLAWSGACDALAGPCPAGRERRSALWALGIATPAGRVPGGTQLALAADGFATPPLRELSRWETLLADYATSGVTLHDHALAILRPRLDGVATSADLERIPHGAPVTVAGLVVARQRPETARGVVFMLLEDEHGAINLVVPPALYERRRHVVRAEPLILAEGLLERPAAGGGTINVLVRELRTLDAELEGIAAAPLARLPAREVHSPAEPAEPAEQRVAAAGFRAVAPAPQSFGRGRR